MTNGCEPWTHPTSGENLRRTRLGICRSGRLALKRCPHSGGFNLYWLANGSPPDANFDTALRDLIAKYRPVAEASDLSQEVSVLCRPGDYLLEVRSVGGQVLFQLEWQLKPSPRRHQPVPRKGNMLTKMR
jgi:hypothetical protein